MTIVQAEEEFVKLLPARQSGKQPSPELRNAAKRWAEMVWAGAEARGPVFLSQSQIEQGLKLTENPVYICGVSHSGATLLHNLLDGHPDLVVLPSDGSYHTCFEPKASPLGDTERLKFFATEWMCRLVNPVNYPPYWLLGTSSARFCPYVDFGRYLLVWWAAVPRNRSNWPHLAVVLAYASATNKLEAKYWVDETAGNECFLERIWQDAPRAKAIQLISEPSSILSAHKKGNQFNIRNTLKDLRSSFRVAAEQAGNKHFLLVRNEELCKQPADTLKAITTFLDIGVSETLTDPTVAGKPVETDLKTSDGSISSNEKKLLHAFMADEVEKLSYPTESVNALSKFYLKLRHRLF